MIAILWLIAIVLLYVAVGSVVVNGMLAFKVRSWAGAIIVVLAAAAIPLVPALVAAGTSVSLIVADVVSVLLSMGAYLLLVRPRMEWRERKAGREVRRQTTLLMLLLTGSFIFLVPFAWLVVTSLKEDEDMSQFPPTWIPRQQVTMKLDGKDAKLYTGELDGQAVTVAGLDELPDGSVRARVLKPANLAGREFTADAGVLKKIRHFAPVWKNYSDALKFLPPETKHGLVFLGNTLFLCALSIIGTLLSSSMVAFSFSRLRWPGRDLCFVVLLATMMLPGAVTMMPVFLIFRYLGWVDTLRPLWVPAFFSGAFNVFLLRQFFMTIPNDLEEAARIDGCSYFGIYWRIMLPLIKPALAALTIMTFMGTWNNFMGPLIYINSPSKMPLAYALQLFQTAHGGEGGLMMAASTMVMLPVLALFFFTQRYFIEGITLTGIKG